MYRTIILAAGKGSRLWPNTAVTNKQLLPIFDKPMIYYTLSLAMLAGSRNIEIIINPSEQEQFEKLLGNGSSFGIAISYSVQKEPRGIPDAFKIIKPSNEPMLLLLGDNLLYGVGLGESLQKQFNGIGCQIFTYQVANPQDYGVVNLINGDIESIEEKPQHPKTNLAIPGMYFFDSQVFEFVKDISPSSRGELEIIDILNKYHEKKELKVAHLERGTAWLDTGNAKSMQSASEFVRVIEERQGFKIGCPEEVALRMNFLTWDELANIIKKYPEGEYKNYLIALLGKK